MELIILGSGGYGRTVADAASFRYDRIRFLDDNSREPDVVGKCVDFMRYLGEDTEFYPAFGNNQARLQWLARLWDAGCAVATIIHPRAWCSRTSEIGEGTVVLPGAMVNTGCRIGRGCILNLGAIVDHGCILEDGVHVCLGAIVKAENQIPQAMKIEAGQVIHNRTWPVLDRPDGRG